MSSLKTNFGCACVSEIVYENNHSCKHRLDIVLRLHIERNFSLAFFSFYCHSLPRFIINHPETVNCGIFLFVFTFVGDFGRELSFKHAARS